MVRRRGGEGDYARFLLVSQLYLREMVLGSELNGGYSG